MGEEAQLLFNIAAYRGGRRERGRGRGKKGGERGDGGR